MNRVVRHAENGAVAPWPAAESSANGQRVSRHPIIAPAGSNDLFSADSLLDREQLLLHVRKQGQLPTQPAPLDADPAIDFPSLLARIRCDSNEILLPPAPFVEPIEPFDSELDFQQIDAVSRALQVPDLLLIEGLSGVGKTRAIVEMIRQAVRSGNRVLLISPGAAAIDTAIAQVWRACRLPTVRLLGKGETSETLLPTSAELVGSVQEQALRADWLKKALETEFDTKAGCDAVRKAATIWDRLHDLAEQRRRRAVERDRLSRLRDSIPAEVTRIRSSADKDNRLEAKRLEQAFTEELAALETRRIELMKERSRLAAELSLAEKERAVLRPLGEAVQSRRFWSPSYWKARLRWSLNKQIGAVQERVELIEQALGSLSRQDEALKQECLRAEQQNEAAWAAWIAEETERCIRENEKSIAVLDGDDRAAEEQFRQLVLLLPAGACIPESFDADAVGDAHDLSAARLSEREQEADFARHWREFVEQDWNSIVRCWRGAVSLVAGPLSSIAADPSFADAAIKPFDLLIVDDAHRLDEAELLDVVRHAQRWVLVGEPAALADPVPGASTRGVQPRKPPAVPDFFARLWDLLDCQIWAREGDRLCCRLYPVSQAKRRSLESETVADRPEIELRILNSTSGEPILAEVVFPAATSRAAATDYIFRELGEVPWPPRMRCCRWEQGPVCLLFRLNPSASTSLPPIVVELSDAVSMRFHEPPAAHGHDEFVFVFDKHSGWDRNRAEAWVTQHLLKRDPGRTCRLERSHRHVPALAAWLNEAVSSGNRYLVDRQIDGAVQFEPVPRRTPAGNRRGGAGLEINLADPEQRELLPAELAALLPARGHVNLPEAQAVVELVKRLPQDHSVVVSAPYATQVAVLKHLCGNRVNVLRPAELANRECDLLVISLTRSHVSRAVTFGDDPATMLGLFTRARCRIILIGDPGTLARRAQWEGAIDHLDAAAGERERRWVNAVVPLLPTRPQNARTLERAKF